MRFADWDTKEICGYAIWGLIISNLRICDLRNESKNLPVCDLLTNKKKITGPFLLFCYLVVGSFILRGGGATTAARYIEWDVNSSSDR
jgi:hypothetical protein